MPTDHDPAVHPTQELQADPYGPQAAELGKPTDEMGR